MWFCIVGVDGNSRIFEVVAAAQIIDCLACRRRLLRSIQPGGRLQGLFVFVCDVYKRLKGLFVFVCSVYKRLYVCLQCLFKACENVCLCV